MLDHNDDTIAAVSTPAGEGGISIIRICGPYAVNSVMQIFHSLNQAKTLQDRYATLGRVMDGKEKIDDVLVTLFNKPNSYTGDETVEISCHGSPFICRRILELLFLNGARPAQPGEFTLRAFLNGKLDLMQAEAVADLIHSKTEESRKAAVHHLRGSLSKQIQDLRDVLIHICSLLEIELDFSEEEIEFASKEEITEKLQEIRNKIDLLIESYERGKIFREGIRIVIAGKPNAGKSSILNCLLEKERAIVTEIPGTTRDTVEDVLDIGGILTYISDTAGIRQTNDPIEMEGIHRTKQAIDTADVVLSVLDKSKPFDQDDISLSFMIKKSNKESIVLVNKIDLPPAWENREISPYFPMDSVFEISALNKTGIHNLVQALETKIQFSGMRASTESSLTNIRHRDCLIKSREAIINALTASSKQMSQEFIALDLRGALDHLGEITGQTVGEEIIQEIFSSFCIGK
jgi:tRNA modification GTPase